MTGDQKGGRPFDILWSDRAKFDLGEIGDYIAADSPIAAKRWIDRLISDLKGTLFFSSECDGATPPPWARPLGRHLQSVVDHGRCRRTSR